MIFDILTIFPEMFQGPFSESIIKRAREAGKIEINLYDLREFATDRHRMVDDSPYGGGAGMVMKVEPIAKALNFLREKQPQPGRVVLLTPQGRTFDQDMAKELAAEERIVLLCGRYEGVDERVRKNLVNDEVSIGDYVLTGGEIPAMVVVDAVSRLQPGVLGDEESARQDSFYSGLLDYPQYTRPALFSDWEVPPILLSGNHQAIASWRKKESLRKTFLRRPDLLEAKDLTEEEEGLLQEVQEEIKPGGKK
ncbi:MAG: tRNA (guanosine(37)-N1)-methyltransferase TrmD [Halanaerobium sp.]|nr:tRNA (guanosine(37)-N1)-methyltransferase TrmD [Halanaerobium sp.]